VSAALGTMIGVVCSRLAAAPDRAAGIGIPRFGVVASNMSGRLSRVHRPSRAAAGEPQRPAGRRELSNQGAGGALEIQAQLGIFRVTRDPRNSVGGAPRGVALGQVDDVR